MTTALEKISPTLLHKFYAAYKGELKMQYPKGKLRKSGKPIISSIFRGFRMNISPRTILIILYGLDFQPLVNTAKFNYCMDEIKK